MGLFGGYSVDDITLVIDMLLEQIDRPDAIEAGIRAGLLLEKQIQCVYSATGLDRSTPSRKVTQTYPATTMAQDVKKC